MRNSALKRMYGITIEQFEEMKESQGGVCANPECDAKLEGRYAHVDHCHETGEIRGILCHYCNLALGNVGDNIHKLEGLVKYLNKNG
jgi:hypothetical protein